MDLSKVIIENLVFEGGGTKGAAYAGCVDVLDQIGLFNGVKRVAGTSAGSITAALLACGAGNKGLEESIRHSQFREFIYDKGWVFGDAYRAYFKYGIHTGDKFVSILKDYIKRFAGDPELTFAQLTEMAAVPGSKFKQLTVVSSNLTRQNPHIFDNKRTPNLPIWKAVRASMSIPVIFEPIQIDGEYHVDGGLCWIYPIDVFDTIINDPNGDEEYLRNPLTLGFYLEQHDLVPDDGEFNPKFTKIKSLRSFAIAMASFLMENANSRHLHPDDKLRTVFIDDLGVSGTDFNTSKEMIDKLIESGRKATKEYFKIPVDKVA